MSLRALLLIFALLLLSCKAEVIESKFPNVQPSGANGGGSGPNVPALWNKTSLQSTLLDLQISQDFIDDFTPADDDVDGHNPIEQMMKQWNLGTTQLDFFQLPAVAINNKNSTSLSSFYDGEMGIYKSYSWFSSVSSNALAITQFFGQRKNIGTASEHLELVHADIMVNYRDFSFSLDATSTTTYDLPSVILHELGHFLGLGHESNFAVLSVMQPYLGLFDSNRSLFNADKVALHDNYDTSALMAAPAGGAYALSANNNREGEGEIVRGIIELRSNGECLHYINGQLVHTH